MIIMDVAVAVLEKYFCSVVVVVNVDCLNNVGRSGLPSWVLSV